MPQTSFSPRMKQTAVSLPDGLRDALGQVIADQRREWRREREVIEAQSRATIAELRAENIALLARIEEMVRERLAGLRDGVDGTNGKDGTDGRDGVDGSPGRDADPVTDDRLDAAVARYLAANPPQAGRDGKDGKDGVPGRDGVDGAPGRDGQDGAPGKDGERGPEGPAGKLPVIRGWTDGVHYEGAVVAHGGATWQALRDTGRAPPHEDWSCIAAAGRDGQDGRSFTIRGTWEEAEAYRHLDVVALNGAAFAARRDDPGPCPGEGWQMISAQGKPGRQGPPGAAVRGLPGPPGPGVVSMTVDDGGLVTLTNGDGTTAELDLYPLLSTIDRR